MNKETKNAKQTRRELVSEMLHIALKRLEMSATFLEITDDKDLYEALDTAIEAIEDIALIAKNRSEGL